MAQVHAVKPQDVIRKFEDSQDALVLQSSDLSLETIASMVDSGAIDLEPKYQRRDRWKPQAQSELIESFLLNVPVPPVYLAEDDFGTYSVIDGKQRITTIRKFLRNEFALGNLPKFKEVSGLKFEQLPRQLQNALNIRPYLRVVTLLKQTNPELKYEVFTRLNTGGQPLLAQEIRNALFRGTLNDLIYDLGRENFLRKQLKIQTEKEAAYKEMQDVESALRFLCISEQWQSFNGDMRRTLDAFMELNKGATKNKLASYRNKFKIALDRCETLWGDHAFRRYDQSMYRDQFLAAIFDAEMVAASELTDAQFHKLCTVKGMLEKPMKALFADEHFENAVRVSTNTPSKVTYRIKAVKTLLLSLV